MNSRFEKRGLGNRPDDSLRAPWVRAIIQLMKLSSLTWRLAGLVLFALSTRALAAPQFFTDQSAFDAAITGASFTTNLSAFPPGQVIVSPATFSANGLSVQAVSTNTGEYNLYSFGNGLTLDSEGFDLFFTNFSLNTTAFGGLFFNLETGGSLAPGDVVLSVLFADLSALTTTNEVTTTNSFFGFVGNTNIVSLTISGQAGLPTAGQLSLGAPVPEPSSLSLVLLSLGSLVAYLAARRRRA